jgi:hypothetical protein
MLTTPVLLGVVDGAPQEHLLMERRSGLKVGIKMQRERKMSVPAYNAFKQKNTNYINEGVCAAPQERAI